MTDRSDFETRLEERLLARAALSRRPFDAAAIARNVMSVSAPRRTLGRLVWPSLRVATRWPVIALLAALALIGAAVGVGAFLHDRPAPPASVRAIAERFVQPFEYAIPAGSKLTATTVSPQMYAFTEGATSTYPGFGYEPVSHVRGITVAFAEGASTHGSNGRADLRLRPASLLDDLRRNPTLVIGPVTGTSVAGLPAVRADVSAEPPPGSAAYPDIHLDTLAAGGDPIVLALGFPSTLTVAAVDRGFLIVHVWAADPDELDAWLPSADAIVSSIRFVDQP